MTRSLSLNALLSRAGFPSDGAPAAPVADLVYDSRRVKPGSLFFAIKGVHSDGHDFLKDVAAKGAVAAVVQRPVPAPIPCLQLGDIFVAMSRLGRAFFDDPSASLPVIGITGTNGKTTTTYLIEDIFRTSGRLCGVLGTITYRLGETVTEAPNTTPFSVDVLRFLAAAREKGAAAVAMEVSSHALEQHRVDDVRFKVGVFTNLTQDHLDFHGTMESYYQAKAKLFKRPEDVRAVVNSDDEYGRRLIGELKGAMSFGVGGVASLRAEDVHCDLNGIRYELVFPSRRRARIETNMLGRHNVENTLSAAGACLAYGLSEDEIVAGLSRPHAVPGRLERVDRGQPFVIAIDYAHTHDALAQVLTTLRNTGPRRLLCVFGAGGDRDKTKRPKMGRVAIEMADRVFVTSDNPRSEDPKAILKDIEAGIQATGSKHYVLIEDREEAIRAAIGEAKPGDIVLIAGKGHETYQIFGNQKVHFSDVEVAEKALSCN